MSTKKCRVWMLRQLRVFCMVLTVLGLTINVYPNIDCKDLEDSKAYKLLLSLVDQNAPEDASIIADSLLIELTDLGLEDCPVFLKIQLERAECMELLGDQYQDALKLYYAALLSAQELGYWEIAAEGYLSIARVHEVLERPIDCRRNLGLAQNLIDEYGLSAAESRFCVRISSYHKIYDDRDSAIIYARRAITLGKHADRQRSELDGHLLMSSLADDSAEAIYHNDQAAKIYKTRQDLYGVASRKASNVRKYLARKQLGLAWNELDSSILFLNAQAKNPFYEALLQSRLLGLKGELFEQEGKLDSALLYTKLSQQALQETYHISNQREINQQETVFAIEREQYKLEQSHRRNLLLLVAFGILVLMLLALTYFFTRSVRHGNLVAKQRELLESTNQELQKLLQHRSLLLSEVHHRVKNNLQIIIGLMTLRGYRSNDISVRNPIIELSHKVQSIGLIHEQLYSSAEYEKVNVSVYFDTLTSHFRALKEYGTFEVNLDVEELPLGFETVLPLGILYVELIQNSLKYGRRPNVMLECSLRLMSQGSGYFLEYRDNGPGYPAGIIENSDSTFGGMLIDSMVRQLQGTSKTFNEEGAVFTISFEEKIVSEIV